jgi:hypothetical protein
VITLGPGGDAEVRYTSTPTGSRAVALREFLANEPGRRQENLEQLLKRDFGAIEIVSHEVSDLLDLGQPVRVEVGFRARRFAAQQGTGLILPGTVGMRELSGLTPTDTRRRALLLGVPNARQQTLTFRLPPGYAPLSIPPPTSLRPPFGTFELSWQRSGDELRVTSRLTLDRDRIPAAQYAAFKQFVTGVDQAARQVVVIEKRGSEVGK